MLKTTGVMINPIRYSKAVAKQVAGKGGSAGGTGVATVAGGMIKAAPKQAGGKRKLSRAWWPTLCGLCC